MPVATFGKHSKYESSPDVFAYPTSRTIDQQLTTFTFVIKEITVYKYSTNLLILFQFSAKMDGPTGICIKHNKVSVTQERYNLLTVYSTDGKCLQSVGEKEKNHLEFDRPRRLDIL